MTREEEVVFQEIWKSRVLSKVLVFSWTLILDRIPTKLNLGKRWLLAIDESKWCVFCDIEDETGVHMFIHCHVISKVKREVMNWLQFNFITPPNFILHINCWSSVLGSKKLKRRAQIIWHVVIWIIWRMRMIKARGVNEIVEQVKVISWQWCLNRLKIPSCLF